MFALGAKFWRGYAYVILYGDNFACLLFLEAVVLEDDLSRHDGWCAADVIAVIRYVALTQEDHIPSFTSCQGTLKIS